jgi:hypothetical protein
MIFERRRKKSPLETYRSSIVDTAQPPERPYQDDSNVIMKCSMTTPKQTVHTIRAMTQKEN